MTKDEFAEIVNGAIMLLGDEVSADDEDGNENEVGKTLAGLGRLLEWAEAGGAWTVTVG